MVCQLELQRNGGKSLINQEPREVDAGDGKRGMKGRIVKIDMSWFLPHYTACSFQQKLM